MALTEDDYKKAASDLNCEVEAVKAVASVESAGDGFLPDGRAKILFEAHIFHRYTKGKFDESHPSLSSPKWNKKLYKGGAAEWDRLQAALELDRLAALMSASYGAFQVMGFNYALCGYKGVEEFVEAMKTEPGQLDAFVGFIKSNHLADELRRQDWETFARIYNGPEYRANAYHVRMANAYAKFKKEEGDTAPLNKGTV